jgi:hypothetical protein
MKFKHLFSVNGNMKIGINQIDEIELFRELFRNSYLKPYLIAEHANPIRRNLIGTDWQVYRSNEKGTRLVSNPANSQIIRKH